MIAGLEFDPVEHRYRLDGQPVPGVSTILQALGNEYAMVDPEVLERAAAIGTAVHWLIEQDVAGTLDEEQVDFHLLPYLDQWRDFRHTSGFEPILSEQQVASRRYGYAGTLDLFGRLNGRKVLIDAKRTAAVPRKAGPQTAGYEVALRECMPEIFTPGERVDRFALHLRPGMRWRLVPFRDAADQRVFLSALTIHNWSRT